MNYLFLVLLIAIFSILPSHWQKLKLKRDKILTITFLVLFATFVLLDFFMPNARRTVWEGRIIIIGLVMILFMIFVGIAEFVSLKKPYYQNKTIIVIAIGIPIIILMIAAAFIAWHYYAVYLPSLR